MSGDGVVSVRLPLSLLGAFRAAAEHQGLTIHQAAKALLAALLGLTQDELRGLPEPPSELSNPRVSLYVGWRSVDSLTSATQNSTLGNSNIFRRLLYGLLVTKEIEFVQQDEHWQLRMVVTKESQKNISDGNEKGPSCA